uniref:Uncharacterized protein n=1 Tax=Arundo donax TaxID=35708 RepID=A0A0A9F1B8_ARUDO
MHAFNVLSNRFYQQKLHYPLMMIHRVQGKEVFTR